MRSGEPDDPLAAAAALYGLLTVEAALAVVPGLRPNAAAKRLAGLVRRRVLAKAAYARPRCYWHPPAAPLGPQALSRRAAVLCYCLLGGGDPRRLCGWDRGAAVCAAGGGREAVFVDLGAAPDHVARKLARYCAAGGPGGLTGLTVLVPTREKGGRVWKAARKHELPVPVSCVAIDDLRELLGR